MKLTVLGCAGSVTPESRTCSFRLGEHAVLEMGSAASTLSLEEQVRIEDVFLTHAHLDHVKDLAFFAENVFGRRERPLRVHALPATLGRLAAHILNDIIWPDFTRLPSAEEPTLVYVPFEPRTPVQIPGLRVTPVEVHHPGGCVALFLDSGDGTLVVSGDTGPTDALWDAVNAAGGDVRGILLETSFPNRLHELAGLSGHLTPRLLRGELRKLARTDIPIYIQHIKAPTREETLDELLALDDPRITILADGMQLEF